MDGGTKIARKLPLFSRASGFGPLFALVAREYGDEAAEALCARNHLPGVAEFSALDASAPVPFLKMNKVFNDAAALIGDHQLGARIGLAMPAERFGPYMAYALSAELLGEVIARNLASTPMQTNACAVRFAVQDGRACWSLSYAIGGGIELDQHALHAMLPLLAVLRDFAGSDADQMALHLVNGHATQARAIEALVGLRVHPHWSFYGFTFPARWLRRRRPAPAWVDGVSLDGLPYYLQRPLPASMAEAVRVALAGRVLDAEIDLDSIAAELGRPGRTLQHALTREGANYRDILRRLRIERAGQMLAHTNRPIAEIAQHVGYSDQANFHRAFVATTGTTPQQRRRQHSA